VTTTGTTNFDDVALDSVLPARVSSFTAVRSQQGVRVRWRTGTEVDELGFNVYRQEGNRRVRVNRRLISAIGAVGGA